MNTCDHRDLTATLLVLGVAALGTAGCGESSVSGAQQGSMSAQVTDDPATSGFAGHGASLQAARSAGSFSGSMRADARVQVSADGSTWVDLDSPRSVTLDLQSSGSTTTVHSTATVSTGTYTRVRLILDNADATVRSGSTIGSTTLSADVQVSIGSGGQVIIEKQVEPVTVSAESQTSVVFDLNSEIWMTEDNVQAQAVSESEIESATSVMIQ